MANSFVDKLLDKGSDDVAGVVIVTMSAVIGAGMLATWPIIKSLDRLSLF
jgi:hypothetical protein